MNQTTGISERLSEFISLRDSLIAEARGRIKSLRTDRTDVQSMLDDIDSEITRLRGDLLLLGVHDEDTTPTPKVGSSPSAHDKSFEFLRSRSPHWVTPSECKSATGVSLPLHTLLSEEIEAGRVVVSGSTRDRAYRII